MRRAQWFMACGWISAQWGEVTVGSLGDRDCLSVSTQGIKGAESTNSLWPSRREKCTTLWNSLQKKDFQNEKQHYSQLHHVMWSIRTFCHQACFCQRRKTKCQRLVVQEQSCLMCKQYIKSNSFTFSPQTCPPQMQTPQDSLPEQRRCSLQTDVTGEWMTHSIVASRQSDINALSGKSVCHLHSVYRSVFCGGGGHGRQEGQSVCDVRETQLFIFTIRLRSSVSALPFYPLGSSGTSAWQHCQCSTPRSDWWNTPGPSWLCGGEWLFSSSYDKWAVKARWKRTSGRWLPKHWRGTM